MAETDAAVGMSRSKCPRTNAAVLPREIDRPKDSASRSRPLRAATKAHGLEATPARGADGQSGRQAFACLPCPVVAYGDKIVPRICNPALAAPPGQAHILGQEVLMGL